jgi:hypothetical protein
MSSLLYYAKLMELVQKCDGRACRSVSDLIVAIDPMFCRSILLALAVWLEIFIESGRGALTPYMFGFSDN